MDPKILALVRIVGFEHWVEPHAETEYWMMFKVTGFIGKIGFAFGKNEMLKGKYLSSVGDVYVTGCHKFRDIKDLVDEMGACQRIEFENTSRENLVELGREIILLRPKVRRAVEKILENEESRVRFFKNLILDKLRQEPPQQLEDLRNEGNQLANEIDEARKSDWG